MKPQNELALIVAYYLSRLDKKGYQSLGYRNFSEAARTIGGILGVKPNTIRNMRDEFDPYHSNRREGWQKELRGSRKKILNSFQETDDDQLLEIVKEILQNNDFLNTEAYTDIQALFSVDNQKISRGSSIYISRGPTGKAAENFFIEYFRKTGQPVRGNLIDRRDFGLGYDFEIENDDKRALIEVKGLSSQKGGILFTNKEWQTAQKYENGYYLVLVRNISSNPEVVIIQNPGRKIKAKKNIFTTFQVSWSVAEKEIQ